MFRKDRGQITAIVVVAAALIACAQQSEEEEIPVSFSVTSGGLEIEFNDQLHSRVISALGEENLPITDFRATEYIEVISGETSSRVTDFAYQGMTEASVETELGSGQSVTLVGASDSGIEKFTKVSTFVDYPDTAFFSVTYINLSDQELLIRSWANNAYNLRVAEGAEGTENSGADADFWSYEGATYQDRRDWVKPLEIGYNQHNYMGMNASDYGSGTAIVDVWRPDVGLAVGHAETSPKLVSMPLTYSDSSIGAEFEVQMESVVTLAPGESMTTLETFVNVHQGDYYATLKNYRTFMADKGLAIDEIPDSAYEAIWCAWGYERNFNVDEVLATLPKAKELGLEWAVLDDGWQTAEGDWYLHPDKFPNGDADMQAFVQKINDAGLKAKLWWAPLAVDPGTDLLHEHSDMLLLDQWGAVHDVTWWNSFYLCPAYEPTREYTKELVRKMMAVWGYEGLKIDGQHLNGVAPCYNPAHNHESPEDSVEQLAEFWELVFETAKEINPDAVIEICPCGTSYAFHNLPFMNQTVSSDPLSSWQVRHKGKTIKGLMGESAPYYGDHVELSDNASDFASSFGVGAILGTKFTVGVEEGPGSQFLLDEEKEEVWAKWFGLYNEMMLPKGTYLGELYDIGFDAPETHAISKDGKMYYAFYADDWSGDVELRGLSGGAYQVTDYFNNVNLGQVTGSTTNLEVSFEGYLLLELTPVEQTAAIH